MSGIAVTGLPAPTPASSRPVPAASATELSSRARAAGWRLPTGIRRRLGNARSAASTGSGASAMKTERQPSACAIKPEMAGPTSPGTTQPVDISASMRGLAAAGKPRPMAT